MSDEETYDELVAQAGNNAGTDEEYIRTVIDTDIAREYIDFLEPLIDRSHSLANRTEGEVQELIHLARARLIRFIMMHPPQGSLMTGERREYIYGENREPLSDTEVDYIYSVHNVIESKITQGRSGWQQEQVTEMRQVQRREDVTSDASGEGLLSSILNK